MATASIASTDTIELHDQSKPLNQIPGIGEAAAQLENNEQLVEAAYLFQSPVTSGEGQTTSKYYSHLITNKMAYMMEHGDQGVSKRWTKPTADLAEYSIAHDQTAKMVYVFNRGKY